MKRILAILWTAMALAGWTFAQSAEDKGQKAEQVEQAKQGETKQAQTKGHDDQDQDQEKAGRISKRRDDIKITGGPTVTPQDTSATIQWKTNKKAVTFVRFGTDANNLDQKQWQKGGSTNHAVTLSNLQPGTLYYFAIMIDDEAVRTNGQFETTGQTPGQTAAGQTMAEQNPNQPASTNGTEPPAASAAQTAPASAPQTPANPLVIVKGPNIEFVTPNAAVIDWSTNARSSSIVHYGKDKNNLDQTAEAPWGSSFHRVTIQNLEPSTTYYFVIESSQAEGTGSGNKSTVAGFQTPAPGSTAKYNPPVIH